MVCNSKSAHNTCTIDSTNLRCRFLNYLGRGVVSMTFIHTPAVMNNRMINNITFVTYISCQNGIIYIIETHNRFTQDWNYSA